MDIGIIPPMLIKAGRRPRHSKHCCNAVNAPLDIIKVRIHDYNLIPLITECRVYSVYVH